MTTTTDPIPYDVDMQDLSEAELRLALDAALPPSAAPQARAQDVEGYMAAVAAGTLRPEAALDHAVFGHGPELAIDVTVSEAVMRCWARHASDRLIALAPGMAPGMTCEALDAPVQHGEMYLRFGKAQAPTGRAGRARAAEAVLTARGHLAAPEPSLPALGFLGDPEHRRKLREVADDPETHEVVVTVIRSLLDQADQVAALPPSLRDSAAASLGESLGLTSSGLAQVKRLRALIQTARRPKRTDPEWAQLSPLRDLPSGTRITVRRQQAAMMYGLDISVHLPAGTDAGIVRSLVPGFAALGLLIGARELTLIGTVNGYEEVRTFVYVPPHKYEYRAD